MHLDFIDVGSSKGGSVRYARHRFGENGYGVDVAKHKVEAAQAAGLDVRWQSIYDVTDTADWVTILHVVEHLEGREQAYDILHHALTIGRRLYITLPYFDADVYLYGLGLKLAWSDWRGHRYQPSTMELRCLMRDLRVDYELELYKPIPDSQDENVVPFSAPRDTIKYSEQLGDKPYLTLDNVYKEVRITTW